MDRLKGLPLGRQIVLGAGVLLLIDTFLDWRQVTVFGRTGGESAWHGFWGIIMCLALIVLLVWTAAKAFEVEVPVKVPDGVTSLGLAAVIFLFALIKALSDSYVHWPAWLGVVLAAVVGYGAWLIFQESGESLPNLSSMSSSSSSDAPPSSPPSAGEE
jgi:membrane-associated phospholipid phosphatase